MDSDPYQVAVVPRAARDLEQLPEKVAIACIEFLFNTLADQPHRLSKPLQRELAGQRSARRGGYRIIFRVDEDRHRIEILHIGYRGHVYGT